MQVDYKGSVSPGKKHIGFRVIPGKAPGREVVLRPGLNTIDSAKWEEIESHPTVKHLIDLGELVVLKAEKGGGDMPITSMSPVQALDLVQRTTEPAVLEAWRKQMLALKGNPQVWRNVAEALGKQIEAVTTDVDGRPAAQRPLQIAAA